MSALSQRKVRLAYLVTAYLFFVMAVARTAVVGRETSPDFLVGTTLAFLVTMTCVADAGARGRPMPLGVRFPFMIVWPIATPVYVLRSRGWWGLLIIIIHAAVLVAALVIWA